MGAKVEKLDVVEEDYATFSHVQNFMSSEMPEKKEKRTRFSSRHEKKIQISVTISPGLLEKFENRVAEVGQTRAAVLSHLIAQWLKV